MVFAVVFVSGCAADTDGVTLFNAGRYVDAHDLLISGAMQGDPDAQNCLGILYFVGLGVPKNPALAAKWFERAAHQGKASAQLNLGLLYLNGFGVAKNHERAYGWLRVAHESGNPRAQNYLVTLTDNLTPIQMVRGRTRVKQQLEKRPP